MDEQPSIKIGTKEEAAWTEIRDDCIKRIEGTRRALEIEEYMLPFLEKKIEDAKETPSD